MKKAKPWWLKGRIGWHFREVKGIPGGFRFKRGRYGYKLVTNEIHHIAVIGITLRGNSKQRRQQRRALLRYLND